MEKDENVCWADLEAQLHKTGHMKEDPFTTVEKIAKLRCPKLIFFLRKNTFSLYLRAEAASTIRSFSTFVFFSPLPAVPSIPKVLWPSILASTILGGENQKMHDSHSEMIIKVTSKL